MKEDLPEEWFPTRKTKGREVPRSEFLARGPWRWVFSGMMEVWRDLQVVRIDCWTEEEMVSSLLSLLDDLLAAVVVVESSSSVWLGGEDGEGFDQFHVDENLWDLWVRALSLVHTVDLNENEEEEEEDCAREVVDQCCGRVDDVGIVQHPPCA
mmetsp:Transcript_10035/g.21697  ORF Transcript_10035/g.21697 Transcript_10035/m.21697 type:complete len:153 (-) Transcript_10035:176-634(-)